MSVTLRCLFIINSHHSGDCIHRVAACETGLYHTETVKTFIQTHSLVTLMVTTIRESTSYRVVFRTDRLTARLLCCLISSMQTEAKLSWTSRELSLFSTPERSNLPISKNARDSPSSRTGDIGCKDISQFGHLTIYFELV